MHELLKIRLKVLKINEQAKLPARATSGSAGMDLYACIDAPITLQAGERALVPTGIAIALPDASYVALVYARSGLAIKHGITLSNCVGVIDSDYRGEVKVGLINLSSEPFTILNQERVAQLVLAPVIQAEIIEAEELDETERGAGGFGSTGNA
ncbi:MAG: dUTP diphosphatase [Oscillospiraceae bacterium]|jgi:dUTP pyrophosphatase|nr:dUTP diphosphatase [Oscillospiraceae bacterium]